MDFFSRGLQLWSQCAGAARLDQNRAAARRRGRRLRLEPLEVRHLLAAATLWPVADSYARGGTGAGSAPVLEVQDYNGNDAIAYLRFDLSGLNIEAITSATLTLHKVQASRN
ncbi:MAG TPA: hypothetical protein PJ982_19035, partial [Lacipirellulaceae bacterium]|nr:hypothetical protein [Lacipirellulaceae bacterium]